MVKPLPPIYFLLVCAIIYCDISHLVVDYVMVNTDRNSVENMLYHLHAYYHKYYLFKVQDPMHMESSVD